MMDFVGGIQLFFLSFAIEQVLDRSDDQVTLNLDLSVVIMTLSLQFIFCFLVSMKIIMSSLKDPMNFLIFCQVLEKEANCVLVLFPVHPYLAYCNFLQNGLPLHICSMLCRLLRCQLLHMTLLDLYLESQHSRDDRSFCKHNTEFP